MNETHIEPTPDTANGETAVPQPDGRKKQIKALFNQGWGCLINQQWPQAEAIFAEIEAYDANYQQSGLWASYLRKKAHFEQQALAAMNSGNLEKALAAFRQADDFERIKKVHILLTIQELETRAEHAKAVGSYQEAAWIYDHLLSQFPTHEIAGNWQIKKESCWEAALMPYFRIGVQALEQQKWRTAHDAFTQILTVDPYFRADGRSAAVLSEIARKEVVLLADQYLRQGQVQQALDAYRQVGHQARIENVDEFLRLREHEEATAQQLENQGKWQEAAAKYTYLCTLYYDENGRSQWQAAADRCLEENRLSSLYDQATSAYQNRRWREAEKLLGQIVALRPDYQPGEQAASKLYRTARWRNLLGRLIPSSDPPSPHVHTGKLS